MLFFKKDVEELREKFKNVSMLQVPLKSFNHLDFMWAIEAKKYVYEPIIAAMKTASEKAQQAAKENLTREKFNQSWQLATEKSSQAKVIATKKFDPAVNYLIGQLNQVF
jgi:hypothetical protein